MTTVQFLPSCIGNTELHCILNLIIHIHVPGDGEVLSTYMHCRLSDLLTMSITTLVVIFSASMSSRDLTSVGYWYTYTM